MLGIVEREPAFHARLEELGWGPLVEDSFSMLSGLVRGFYAILVVVCWDNPNPTIRIIRVDFSVDAETINEVLELLEVSNPEFDARIKGMDLVWLRNTQIEEMFRDQVYEATTKGITSNYFTIDARRWLTLVAQRIRLSGNLTNVTYPQALVVACTIERIWFNMEAQIVSEWKDYH